MKCNFLLMATVLLCLLANSVTPASVSTRAAESALACDETPSLGLQAALQLAEEHAKSEKIDLSKHYPISARLISKTDSSGKRAWEIVWDGKQKAADDEIEFIVEMDKTVTR